MAAVTTAVVAGSAALLTAYGMQEQKNAAKKAAKRNAEDAEQNAALSEQQATEDERVFRLSFRRDQARNVAQIGASGVKQEGSPLEVLQDNAAGAERDAENIRLGGRQQRDSYLRQARNYREGGAAAGRAADIGTATALLNGAVNTYQVGDKSGAWK